MKRLMSREMLQELISLVEPHKQKHSDLYDYLMLTWTSCHHNSTLYACNVDGMIIMQKHLSKFDEQDWRLYNKEKELKDDLDTLDDFLNSGGIN